MKNLLFILILLATLPVYPQFAPAAGQSGSTAIHRDSSAIMSWASECSVKRGLLDISNPVLGYASSGDSSMATGKADGAKVVSLGDGGTATLGFLKPITNGPGYDFAVFENSFSDTFLEFAFVEVSSDGTNYFRFPSVCNTSQELQVEGFGETDPTKIHNLAGKYRGLFGTPFDLEELKAQSNLDVSNITHVRVIDVVGTIEDTYASHDSKTNKINDPWPTPFPSCGFDLDAIAVIHEQTPASVTRNGQEGISIYPNPLVEGQEMHVILREQAAAETKIIVFNLNGETIREWMMTKDQSTLDMTGFSRGVYILTIVREGMVMNRKMTIQ